MAHCDEALTRIGKAITAYQEKFAHQNPPDLQTLIDNQSITPWDLVCPVSPFEFGQCPYIYRGGDLDADAPPKMILAYDKLPCHKGRRNVLFTDGKIIRPPEKLFQSFIRQDNQLRRELNLPEKSA